MEDFLAALLQFQHFRQFINHKIEQLKNQTVARDIFDKEAMFYDEGMRTCTQACVGLHVNVCVVTHSLVSPCLISIQRSIRTIT